VGFLPENPYFYDYLTGYEFLYFYARLFDIYYKERKNRINRLLDMVGLSKKGNISLRSYSKGMLQRIGIAQALLNNPQFIMLDEPMSGLDPIGRKHVRDIILQLKDQGRTIFLSSHIISDIENIADKIVMIHQGKKIDTITMDELSKRRVANYEIVINFDNQAIELHEDIVKKASEVRMISDKRILVIVDKQNEVDHIIKWAQEHSGHILSISDNKVSLEDFFLSQVSAYDK